MKQFLTVLKFELNNYFKNKSFIITTVVFAILLAGVVIVPAFIPGLLGEKDPVEEQKEAEENLDALGIYAATDEVKDLDSLLLRMPADWKVYEDEDSLKKAVKDGETEAGFILNGISNVTYVVNDMEMSDRKSGAFQEALTQEIKEQKLIEAGISKEEIKSLENMQISVTPEILGKNSAKNYMYTYILVFILYFLILFYGQMIAVAVTTEKSNRAIEILVTSVNPNSLIFGKVLAGAVAGILQMTVILGAGFGAYHMFKDKWGGMLDFLFNIPGKVLLSFIIFGILSYLLYAFIYGALGAMVSKTEDISKSSSTITFIYVASFLIGMFCLSDCNGLLAKIASFIPFTSGNAMFIRISMGSVAVWEILVSGVLLAGSCVVTGILAAKLFRFGTLHYGNPLKIRNVLKKLRQQ